MVKPRESRFMGMVETAHVFADGTWLEPESLCYPHGGMTRRAFALCEDGIKRVVVCGIPDTFFSIPGRVTIEGKRVRGFLSGDSGSLRFTTNKKQ